MYTSRLIQVLKKLSAKEIKDFDSYLYSSVLSNRKGGELCLQLFREISKYHPSFDSPRLNKENIFKKVYQSKIYNNTGKLEKLMSNLFAILQDFIVYNNSELRKEMYQYRVLHSFYAKRGLHNLANLIAKKYLNFQKKETIKNNTFFYDSFLLEKQLINVLLLAPSKQTVEFSKAHLNLDNYYVFEKLELACRALAIHQFLFPVQIEKDIIILEHLIPLLEKDFFDEPVIKIYYKAFKFLSGNEDNLEQRFSDFEMTLKIYYDLIPEELIGVFVTIIRNYCVKRYHEGVEGYLEKTFETYQEHLEKGYLYTNGKLFASTMMNVVVFGLRLKRYKWIFNFIESHKEKIIGISNPPEAYKLNLANYYFHVKEYEKALDLLENNYEDSYYKLRAKRLEIKAYFESNHVLLDYKMNAFKIFVFRFSDKKVSNKHKKGNRDFIDILKQIKLPKTYKNDKRIEKLKTKIQSFSFINEKEWLLQQLELLR